MLCSEAEFPLVQLPGFCTALCCRRCELSGERSHVPNRTSDGRELFQVVEEANRSCWAVCDMWKQSCLLLRRRFWVISMLSAGRAPLRGLCAFTGGNLAAHQVLWQCVRAGSLLSKHWGRAQAQPSVVPRRERPPCAEDGQGCAQGCSWLAASRLCLTPRCFPSPFVHSCVSPTPA